MEVLLDLTAENRLYRECTRRQIFLILLHIAFVALLFPFSRQPVFPRLSVRIPSASAGCAVIYENTSDFCVCCILTAWCLAKCLTYTFDIHLSKEWAYEITNRSNFHNFMMISHETDDTAHFLPTSYLFHKKERKKEGGREHGRKRQTKRLGHFLPCRNEAGGCFEHLVVHKSIFQGDLALRNPWLIEIPVHLKPAALLIHNKAVALFWNIKKCRLLSQLCIALTLTKCSA